MTTCAQWQAIPQNQVTPLVSAEARRFLLQGHPYGWQTQEWLEGVFYNFLSEEHPPDSRIDAPHPGITVTRCPTAIPPPFYRQSPWLAAGGILAASLVIAVAVAKL